MDLREEPKRAIIKNVVAFLISRPSMQIAVIRCKDPTGNSQGSGAVMKAYVG